MEAAPPPPPSNRELLVTHPRITQGAPAVAAIALGAFLWSACSDNVSDFPMGPSAAALGQSPDIHAAIAAQGHHTDALLRIPGVVGTAVALVRGKAAVRIFVERADVRGLPGQLDGMPVDVKVTGRFMALSDPTTRQRPAPLGYSVGHPAITAGSLCRRRLRRAGGPPPPQAQKTARKQLQSTRPGTRTPARRPHERPP